MSSILGQVLIIFVLILANAFFAGAEIAVVSVRKTRLQELAEAGRADARAVLALRDMPERFLATVQVGITLIGATAAVFGGATLAEELAVVLERTPWMDPYAEGLALAAVIAGISFLSVVIGELVPKSLALRGAEPFSLLVGRFLLLLSKIARPLVWLLSSSANLILKPFKDQTTFTETRHSADELQQLLEEAAHAGTIHPEIGHIAARAIERRDLRAVDVMVPRNAVVMLPRDADSETLQRIVLAHPHARIPVYEDQRDHVVGYVSIRDLLGPAWEQRPLSPADVMRPAYFVHEGKPIRELLGEMRQRHTPFAIVVDEHGALSGIVTLEDLIEELVGEIWSEHAGAEPTLIEHEGDGSLRVRADVSIRDINLMLPLELPDDGPWRTVAGLYLALAGHIPSVGETLSLPNGLRLEVVDASARRIGAIRVRLPEKPADD
jgi:putative hemolysin